MQETTVTSWDQGWAPLYDAADTMRMMQDYLDFYAGLVTPGTASLLDLGCGTGSVTVAVAEAMRAHHPDAPALGIDLAPAMIDIAAARDGSIGWAVGDICAPPVTDRYDLVICCFHTLQLLPDDAALGQALAAARRAMAPGARLAFDIYQPNLDFLKMAAAGGLEPGRIVRRFPDRTGRELIVREEAVCDPDTLTYSGTWFLHDAETDARLPVDPMVQTLRQIYPEDLARHMAATGLAMVERYGDLDGSNFTPDSKRQVVICAPA